MSTPKPNGQVGPESRLHHLTAGDPSMRTMVLLHGFPQTSWEWRHVIPGLVDAGFHVVAPDLRGADRSLRPDGGYDKVTLAADVRTLVVDDLAIERPIVIVGHDIGLMVAYAYAQEHRADVSNLVVIDALLPGTDVFDRLRTDRRLWHFGFHAVRDLPEILVAGRERPYLRYFFDRSTDPNAIAGDDFDRYASAYSEPGAMRAGFEWYRAFDQDAADNRATLERRGRLTVPVLAVGGATSISGPVVEEMMREVAEDVTGLIVPGTAHWIPEEAPMALTAALVDFAG